MTIITRDDAVQLLRSGVARAVAALRPDDRGDRGDRYIAIDRLDLQRTDHYVATDADCARVIADDLRR